MFGEAPGSYDICPVCFWEDDLSQLRWPDTDGGANVPSLIDAQANVARFGAMEWRFIRKVRAPRNDEPMDPEWRRFDLDRDEIEEHNPGSRLRRALPPRPHGLLLLASR